MKRILVVSLIALLAPAIVFAAQPAAKAGAKSGSTVMGGVSAGTIAAGTLAVAVVGAAILSNGGDGGSASTDVNELPADLQTTIDNLTKTMSAQQKQSFDYILVQAGSVAEVADVLDAFSAALNTPGVTQADVDAVFAEVYNAKDKDSALAALRASLFALRAKNPALFAVVSEFVDSLDTTQLAAFANVVKVAQTAGVSFDTIAKAIIEDNGGSVTPVTPTHTPSKHFTPVTHNK